MADDYSIDLVREIWRDALLDVFTEALMEDAEPGELVALSEDDRKEITALANQKLDAILAEHVREAAAKAFTEGKAAVTRYLDGPIENTSALRNPYRETR